MFNKDQIRKCELNMLDNLLVSMKQSLWPLKIPAILFFQELPLKRFLTLSIHRT